MQEVWSPALKFWTTAPLAALSSSPSAGWSFPSVQLSPPCPVRRSSWAQLDYEWPGAAALCSALCTRAPWLAAPGTNLSSLWHLQQVPSSLPSTLPSLGAAGFVEPAASSQQLSRILLPESSTMLLEGVLLAVQGKNQRDTPGEGGRPRNSLLLGLSGWGSGCPLRHPTVLLDHSQPLSSLLSLVKPGMGVGVELFRGGSQE